MEAFVSRVARETVPRHLRRERIFQSTPTTNNIRRLTTQKVVMEMP